MKMNFLTKSICGAAVMLFAFSLQAKNVSMGFHVGDITAAELSRIDLKIIDRENSPYPNAYRNPAYAVVVVKLMPRRSLHPEDYSLKIGNITAKCMAITLNDGNFISSTPTNYADGKGFFRMVFVFDGSKLRSNGKALPATLVSHITGRSHIGFNITDLGKKPFTSVKKIPQNGLLQ